MQVKPAQATLNALGDGHVMAELAQAIHEAIGAVNAQNKAATVILTVTIAPMKKQGRLVDAPLLMSGEVSTKLPKPDPAQTLFYLDDDGNPTRTQTRQPDLPLSISPAKEQISNG
jgi:hypothetical protein